MTTHAHDGALWPCRHVRLFPGPHNGGVSDAAAGFPVHRTGGGVILAWVWIGCVVGAAAAIVWSHSSPAQVGGGLVLLATVGPAYVWGLRPRLEENPDGLLVVNPLREIHVPWSTLTYARVVYVLRLWTVDGDQVAVFAVPRETSTQRLRRRGMSTGLPFTGPIPGSLGTEVDPTTSTGPALSAPERIAFALNERVERNLLSGRAADGQVTVGWSPVALRVLGASVASAALGLLLATL